jgi:hypothetical protein
MTFHNSELAKLVRDDYRAEDLSGIEAASDTFSGSHRRSQRTVPIRPDADTASILALLVRYFHAIRFFEDEDSGHWEEQPQAIGVQRRYRCRRS